MADPVFDRPFEVSADEYPFQDHWLTYRDGHIHYPDEGDGPTVLLLHGNPTWSYLYRNVIKELRGECRLIAPDYPGFGMSTAPANYGFTPREHSEMLDEFITRLDLRNFVIVVQDWGGPIGMNYAVAHRDNIRRLVLMNTWAWPATLFKVKAFSLAMGGWPIGYWLQTRRNFFARTIVPGGIFTRKKSRTRYAKRMRTRSRHRSPESRRGSSQDRYARSAHGSPTSSVDFRCCPTYPRRSSGVPKTATDFRSNSWTVGADISPPMKPRCWTTLSISSKRTDPTESSPRFAEFWKEHNADSADVEQY